MHGLGGVGKTQIALEYAYRHESDYNYIFWISAVDQAQLLSDFVDIAKATQIVKYDNEPADVAKSVLQWLEVTESWLLIIDNLDDLAVADGYLPTTTGVGHTLITTRNNNIDGILAERMEVMVMGSEECVNLLLGRINLECTKAQARRIVEELGFLPLAIEQAAGYIRNSQNIAEFLENYKREPRELLNRRPDENHPYRYTVAATLKISLQRLRAVCPNSIVLVQFLVFQNGDEILLEFIKAGMEDVQPGLRFIINNILLLQESLNALESYSLIRIFFGGQKICIHRLVQAVIQDDMDSQLRAQVVSDVLRLGLRSFRDISDQSQRKACRRYRGQVVACLENSDSAKHEPEWLALADRLALYLLADGFYAECLHWAISTFDVRKERLGPEQADTLNSMTIIAMSNRQMGRIKEAAQLHEETLEIRRRVLGLEHQETLASMNHLAASYWDLGRTKEAAQLEEETLEIRRRVLGLEHQETLSTMNNLAASYRDLGRTKEAVQLHEETLEVRRRVLGSEHQKTLISMNNLAVLYQDLGRAQEAAQLCEETLEIRRRALGLEHQETLSSMHNLAVSYQHLRRTEEAAPLHEETLEIRRRVLGLEHQETLASMHNLALAYQDLGRTEEAAQLHKETLEIRKRVLGLEHPSTLNSLEALARSDRKSVV